jgi:hypothetical protein
MIALGTVWIGKYRVWTTQALSVFHEDPDNHKKQIEDLYYDVLLVREDSPALHVYINLVKDEKFKHLFHLDERGYPTPFSDQNQYRSYQERKDMGQPMWKLSAFNLEKLLCVLDKINQDAHNIV